VPLLYGKADNPEESAVNVLHSVVWKAQKEPGIQVDDWALRYPTNTEDVARVTKDIAVKYFSDNTDRSTFPKVLQFSSEDCYTKYQICEMFALYMGLPTDGLIANKQGNDPNATVQRPYDTHLSTRVLKDLGIPIWTNDFVGWW
jgi:S-adenosylmethionine synthetase